MSNLDELLKDTDAQFQRCLQQRMAWSEQARIKHKLNEQETEVLKRIALWDAIRQSMGDQIEQRLGIEGGAARLTTQKDITIATSFTTDQVEMLADSLAEKGLVTKHDDGYTTIANGG